MSKSIWLEAARPVEDFLGKDGDVEAAFDAARTWIPPERWLRGWLKCELEAVDIHPRRSREFTIGCVRFLECDSGNITHAGAIYEYEAIGPDALVDKFRSKLEEQGK